MSKGKLSRAYKRAMAFFMAAALVISTFQGMSITAYATEDIVISDTDLQETEEIVEEQVAEETTAPVTEVTAEPEETSAPEEEEQEAVVEGTPAPKEEEQEAVVEETPTPEEEEQEAVVEETPSPEATETPGEPAEEATTESEAAEVTEATEVPEATVAPEEVAEPVMEGITQDTTLAYTGSVYADGEGLGIYFYEMSGIMDFTDENLVAILESHAGETYKYIQINYPDIPDKVGQDVWNAVKSIAAEDATFFAGFTGGGMAADEMWVIKNPTEASGDVELSANWVVEEDGTVSVSFGNTVIPAESNYFTIDAYQQNTEDIYNSLKSIFPASGSTKIKNASGNRVGAQTHYVESDDSMVCVYIYDINLLAADTTYSVSKVPTITYKGTTDEEQKTLEILASEISEAYGVFNDDILIDVIDANRTNYYSSVIIDYDEVKDVINKNVWNKAVELLTGDAPELIIGFPGGSAPNENWVFINPGETANDLDTSIDVTVNGAGGGATVSFGNTTFPADSAMLVYNFSSDKTGIEDFKNAFYKRGEYYVTSIRDDAGNDVEGLGSNFIVDEDGSARFVMELYAKTEEGANQLASGKAYTILAPCGGVQWEDEVSGATGLDIVLYEMGRESITVEEIQKILAENGDTRFDEILIEYPFAETTTIPADILNAMAEYLKWSEGHEQWLRIAFNDRANQQRYEWRLLYPGKQTEDKTVSAVFSAEQDSEITIQASGASFNADRVDFFLEIGNENAKTAVIRECFGEENIPLSVGELSAAAHYIDYGDYVQLYFDGVNSYDGETAYTLADGRYFGDIQTDDAGNQRLIIDYQELWNRGQDDSPEAFVDIINRYSGIEFVAVHITVPAGANDRVNEIDKGIYNAALKLLTTDANREGIYYNFNHDEKNILWYLAGGSALTKDVTLEWAVDPNEFGKLALKVKLPSAKDLGKAAVRLAVEYVKGTGDAEMLQEFLGEGAVDGPDSFETTEYRLFPRITEVENGGDPVKWVDMGETLKVGFRTDLCALTKDAEYTIVNKFPAQVNEDEWGRNLSISKWDIGKASFAAGDLADCLSYYVAAVEAGEMEPFNQIHVEQSYVAGKNTIRKNDINLLLKLLPEEMESGENNRNLTFCFCNCQHDESTDINYVYDMNWNLFNPKTATKNIDANVTLKATPNQGVTFKVAENTYKAEDVSVQFRIHKDTEMGANLIAELGDVTEEGRELVVLNKKTLSLSDNYADCWGEEDNSVYSLNINKVATCAADTDYLVAQVHDAIGDGDIEKYFYIADNDNNVKKLSTIKTPDAGTLSWKSYNTSVLRIAADGSSVEALNPNEIYYAASFKVDGVKTVEVYKNLVEARLNSMQFTRSEIEMTLPEEGADWIAEDYLSLQFYPSVAGKDPRELEWTIEVLEGEENVPVIELHEESYWISDEENDSVEVMRNNGGITAVNPGKVRVTAMDPITKISASCDIVVYAPAQIPDYAWPDAWAVTNFDTTLETVEFHTNNVPQGEFVSWRWEDPDMSLASFKNMDGHDFNAIYTMPDGREITCKVWVRMVTIEGLWIHTPSYEVEEGAYIGMAEPANVLGDGETVTMDFDYMIRNGNYEEIAEYVEDGNVSVTWSSNPKGIGGYDEEGYFAFTADTSSETAGKGKKTFTVTLKNEETDTVIAKASHTVTVVGKNLTAWDEMEIDWQAKDESGVPGEEGTLVVKLPDYGYNRLTFTTMDTGICTLGKKATVDKTSEEGYVITKISYKIKKAGTVFIKITSADEIKSTFRLEREIRDISPKYTSKTISINKRWEDKSADFDIQLADDTILHSMDPEAYTLEGKGAKYFDIYHILDLENGTMMFTVSIKDNTVPTGNYELQLNGLTLDYFDGDEEYTTDEYANSISVSIKVINSKPSVSFDQNGKVNLFYTDEEGYAEFTSVTGGYQIYDLALVDCDYELIYPEDGLYLIKLKDGASGSDKKGKVTYKLFGYASEFSKSFTVKTEKKAPALKVSSKSDVLYPKADKWNTMLELTNKSTNEPVEISRLQWVKNAKKKQYLELPVNVSDMFGTIDMKNSYIVNTYYNRVEFHLNRENLVGKTDKISLRVWEENWKEPVTVTYSIKTVLKTPKLALSNKTITINVNEDVYKDQMVGTKLIFEDATVGVQYALVSFVGANAKSREILNDNVVLEYWGDTGGIWARFNARNVEDRPEPGKYIFNVYTEIYEKNLSTKLTVNIVDVPVSKCLTVTKKGSIDVLNREGTSITYTPKIKSVSGTITDAWLTGRDADMFDFGFDGKKLIVQARVGTAYSTSYSYKVTPVFCVQNEDGSEYQITGKTQSVKVKQGKAKLTVSSSASALYRDRANEMEISFKAVSEKNTPVVIEDVNLVNYQSDLALKEWWMTDEWNNEYMVYFNPDTQSVTLSQQWIDKIVAKNKTYKVKFEVRFRDKAGNTSTQQVTYKIAVK